MAEAKRDQNRVTTLIGVSDADGTTPTLVYVEPTTNRLYVDALVTGGFGNQDGVVDNEVVDAADTGVLILGTDGTNYQILATDATGNLQVDVLTGGGGTQYATQVAYAAGNLGSLALVVRNDALADLAGVDGDYTPLQVNADGALYVDVSTASIAVTGTFYQTTQPVSLTSTTLTSVTPGVAATSLGKAEDAGHTSGDVGVMALAVENEDGADLSTGDKDYTPIAVTKEGNVIVKQEGTIAVTESTPLTGFATSALQLPDGHAVTVDNINTNEVFVRGSQSAGSAVDGEVVTVQGIAGMTAIATTESAPLTGFATSAKQLADGHNVTIDNASGGSAVNIQDGGNTITVDGSVALTNDSIVGPGDPVIDSYAHIAINLGVVTDSVLVASAADKQIWVYGITYTCSVAGTVSFQDEDNTAITGVMDHAANSGLSHPASGNFAMPIWKLATNKDLEVDTVTCSIDGWLDYAIVSV